MKKIIVVADWAHDSLTCQEVTTAIEGFSRDMTQLNLHFVSSTPSTIHTAFLLQQIVQTEERYGKPFNTVIFENTDPRIQAKEGVEKAKGAPFIILKLKNGMFVCGPNAGYDFSLLRSKIEYVYRYPNLDKGSQFRSRDLYSRVTAHLADELADEMDLEEIAVSDIPALSGFHIGHIDNFGNIKTTITREDLKGKCELGESINITIAGHTKKVTYVSNLFGGTPGQLVIYPGSSGHPDNPYLEISVWRHFTEKNVSTGREAFGNPHPGEEITL